MVFTLLVDWRSYKFGQYIMIANIKQDIFKSILEHI